MNATNFDNKSNDTVVVEQYFDTFRRSEHLEPEKVLLLAILQDAIHCFQKFSKARGRTGRQQFRDAEDWIMSTSERADRIFSFVSICELVGLDPQYIRKGLVEWRARQEQDDRGTKHAGLRRRAA